MTDLESRLHEIDRVRYRGTWDEVTTHGAHDVAPVGSPRSSRHSRLAAATLALLIGIAGVIGVVLAFQGDERPASVKPSRSLAPPEMQRTGAEFPEASGALTLAAETRIAPTGFVSSLIYGAGSVWASSALDSEGPKLRRLDPQTLEEIAAIPLHGTIGFVTGGGGLAFQGRSLWVFENGRVDGGPWGPLLERIDTGSNQVVETISIPSEPNQHAADVAVADSGIWLTLLGVGDAGADVIRLDPATHEVLARISLEGEYAREIVATDNAVLVQERIWSKDENLAAEAVLSAIDPATNRVLATVAAHEQDVGLSQPVAWGDQVWAGSTGRSGLVRVDPATAAPSEFMQLSAPSCCNTTLGPGGIWFTARGEGGHLVGILDPDKGAISTVYEAPQDAEGIDVAASAEGMYFLDYDGFVRRYVVG